MNSGDIKEDGVRGPGQPGFRPIDMQRNLRSYLIRSLMAGVLAGIPVGWLLAYLAVMPYFLGLFFFMVFGLLIGALMFRVARPAAPVARQRLTPISLIVALSTWLTVLAVEYSWFPGYAASQLENVSLISDMSKEQIGAYHEQVRVGAQENLRKLAWPGSFPGYLRWAASSGKMTLPRTGGSPPYELRNLQPPLIWAIRVCLSLVMLIFGIDSQFSSLAPKVVKGDGESSAEDTEVM